nr:hypothetical protein [uncultured Flavobacterium sp.]
MVFIDYNKYRPSKKWKNKAKKQLKILQAFQQAGNSVKRNKHIDNRQYVWSEIKSQILKVTYNKCWFTEGTSDVAHFHIEHFRPKKLVEVLPNKFAFSEARTINENNCYWWLAFDYNNFRICGAIINSFKGNYFPLQPGSSICTSSSANLSLEKVVLLDPTIESDTKLLTFDIDGTPIPSANQTTNNTDYLRADLSIKIYGLKSELIVSARNRKLADLNILIERINKHNDYLDKDPTNAILRSIITDECSDLITMANESQPFSSMVKKRIEFIPYQWVTDFVQPYI